MEKTVQLKIRREMGSSQQQHIIKLKGSLISRGYTEIIHIMDQDNEFYINYFETPLQRKSEVLEFINAFIDKENLLDSVTTQKD